MANINRKEASSLTPDEQSLSTYLKSLNFDYLESQDLISLLEDGPMNSDGPEGIWKLESGKVVHVPAEVEGIGAEKVLDLSAGTADLAEEVVDDSGAGEDDLGEGDYYREDRCANVDPELD